MATRWGCAGAGLVSADFFTAIKDNLSVDEHEVLVFCNIKQHNNGPRQANLVLIAYESSEGLGEPVHPCSLARTSAARSYKQRVKRNLQTETQIPGPSEWLGMRS